MAKEAKAARKQNNGLGIMHNAEDFNNYVHAVSIPLRVGMAAIVIFLAGALIYCFFGKEPVYIKAAAVSDGSSSCVCYVLEDDRDGIQPGNEVTIEGETYTVENVSSESTSVDESIDAYARSIGGLNIGDRVFLVTVDGEVPSGVYTASIVTGYLKPIAVLLNG